MCAPCDTITGMSETEQFTPVEPPRASQSGLVGNATLMAIGSAASRVLGLAREVMITALFGATGEVSAFRVASQVPVLLYDFLVGGMLSAAFVPVLSQYAKLRSRAEFGKLVGILAAVLGVFLLLLVALLELAAPQIAWLLAGGLSNFDPALLDLTIQLLRLSLPAVWFMCMAGLVTATLLALERFSFPSLTSGIYNLGILCIAPLLAQRFGVMSLVIGMLVGTAAQLLAMVYDLWRAGVPVQFKFDWHHPALAQIVRLYLPIAAGIVVSLFQVGLDRRLATSTQPESVAWMANATTLQQLPLGLISIAISWASLPRLSQYFVQKDEVSYRSTLGRGLRMVLLLMVPSAVLLWVLGEPVIRILFERNRFTPADTAQVAAALDIYVVGMLFAAIDYPLNLAFYARQNTKLPALVGVVSVGFYLLAAWALMGPLGFLGLVWADTAKQIGHALIMMALISWHAGMRGEMLEQGTLRIALAGVVSGLVTWGLALVFGNAVGYRVAAGLGHDLLLLVVAGGGGLLAYALLLHWMRLHEFEMVKAWFWQRLGRR